MSDPVIPCPSCGRPTASMKRYVMIDLLVFLGIFAFTRRATCTGCPACMRKTLLTKTLINIVPANVLWVLVVLPFHSVQLARTFAQGHSASVRALLR